MNNEIRIRKRRFIAGMLTFLLLLNQLLPVSSHAADAYGVEDLYKGQILNPDDTISNSTNTFCAITYYDHGETGGELSSGVVDQNTPHKVPAYTGNVPEGFKFTGWQVLYVGVTSGDEVESITLQAMVAINGTEIGDALYDTKLYPGTVIYSQWDTYTITYRDQNGNSLGAQQEISPNTPYKVAGYTGTVPEESQFTGWKVSYVYASSGAGSIELTAQFTRNQYTIEFVDADGTVLQSSAMTYGETPVYSGETPAKAATAAYSYTFAGWTPEITAVTGDATYTATFTETANQYTIEFVNADGTVLQSSAMTYGETPVYNGETPTKATTAEHSYTFAGWTPEITAVTGDATYTATFTETANQYTIEFVNADGTVLQSGAVAYGEIPVYNGETPAKAATAEHSYTFAGWTPEITAVTGDATYTATFTETANQYTIEFVNADGTVLQSSTVTYGETPVYSGETPAKAATAAYSYTFAGWTPEITAVTGDATYTATFTETANQYTIEFVNADGTVLQSGAVAYGEIPVYNGETPAKEATAEYTYSFAGWTPAIAAVTGNATYTATYTETVNQYTITFDTAGGSSIAPITQAYGTAVTAPDDPTRTGYSFVNWNPEIPATMPAEDITILARWTANEYTISFDTDGGSNVDTITQNYGTVVTAPADPTKTGYRFAGWDKTIPTTMPAENITVTARWIAESYSIRYILNGGTNGENPGSYSYGTGVSGFADAVKPGYSFVGWYENADFSGNPVTSVPANRTGDITLYAKFEMGTIEAGTYSLTAGVAYKLGNVTKVSGDNSVYTAGSIFYVPTSGTYTFS